MSRREWHTLPAQACTAITERCGSDVVKAEPPTAGRNSEFSATLHLVDETKVFCKGITTDSQDARMHRTEAQVNPWLPAHAPRLLWQVEQAGWLLLGFEHVTGQHANLSPGSPHLPLIADTVSALAVELTPCPPVPVPTLSDKFARMSAWRRLRDDPPRALDPWTRDNLDLFAAQEPHAIELVAGNTLAHTDMHSLNILVGQTASVIDWAWTHTAPPWVDTAYLAIRLIEAGHTPAQAEQWAATTPAWSEASSDDLTTFAIEVYGMWEYLRHTRPLPAREAATKAARIWVQHRLGER